MLISSKLKWYIFMGLKPISTFMEYPPPSLENLKSAKRRNLRPCLTAGFESCKLRSIDPGLRSIATKPSSQSSSGSCKAASLEIRDRLAYNSPLQSKFWALRRWASAQYICISSNQMSSRDYFVLKDARTSTDVQIQEWYLTHAIRISKMVDQEAMMTWRFRILLKSTATFQPARRDSCLTTRDAGMLGGMIFQRDCVGASFSLGVTAGKAL